MTYFITWTTDNGVILSETRTTDSRVFEVLVTHFEEMGAVRGVSLHLREEG